MNQLLMRLCRRSHIASWERLFSSSIPPLLWNKESLVTLLKVAFGINKDFLDRESSGQKHLRMYVFYCQQSPDLGIGLAKVQILLVSVKLFQRLDIRFCNRIDHNAK